LVNSIAPLLSDREYRITAPWQFLPPGKEMIFANMAIEPNFL